MCRSIRTLRGAEPPATEADVRAAALQFVRKLSGYRAPSAANRAAFEAAFDEVARASVRLLAGLVRGRVGAAGPTIPLQPPGSPGRSAPPIPT